MKTRQENSDPGWTGNTENDIYKENLIDHYKHPHNFGILNKPTFSSKGNNPLCGDQVEIFAEVKDDKISDIKFSGSGCAISMASASMLTDKIKGMEVDKIKNIKDKDIFKMIGTDLGVVRAKCGLLGLKTLIKGANEYKESGHGGNKNEKN